MSIVCFSSDKSYLHVFSALLVACHYSRRYVARVEFKLSDRKSTFERRYLQLDNIDSRAIFTLHVVWDPVVGKCLPRIIETHERR